MNTKNNNSINEQLEQIECNESALSQPVLEKKPFVEPTVSVPVDVLEATAFFQGPTVDTISTLTT
ncbi:MAG: hypothetical protein ACR2G4_01740 [Pyrinomonadaceae bacterium]